MCTSPFVVTTGAIVRVEFRISDFNLSNTSCYENNNFTRNPNFPHPFCCTISSTIILTHYMYIFIYYCYRSSVIVDRYSMSYILT